MKKHTHTDVALVLWNSDVIQLMSWTLLRSDLQSSGMEPSQGTEKIENWIHSCAPSVVVIDLAPPYDQSAAAARHMMHRFRKCSFVMTCSDSKSVLKNAPWLSGYPLFQKPYEIHEIAETVRSLARQSEAVAHRPAVMAAGR